MLRSPGRRASAAVAALVTVAAGGCPDLSSDPPEPPGPWSDAGPSDGGVGNECYQNLDCDDAVPCTDDRCVAGTCRFSLTPDGAPCAACFLQQVCIAGDCVAGEPNPDVDGDGHVSSLCGGPDCDDRSAAIPALELGASCSDGVDNDCDSRTDAFDVSCSGDVCDEGGFCWEHPLPSGRPIFAAWPVSPSEGWFVGDGATRVRTDGDLFFDDMRGLTGPAGMAARLFGFSPGDIWAVTDAHAWHWDGTSWTPSLVGNGSAGLYEGSVWGAPNGDVWLVGDAGVFRFRAGVWETIDAPSPSYGDVWGFGADDVWLVGPDGEVVRTDGVTFDAVPSAPTEFWSAIWGSAADDVYLASQPGDLYHFDGASFSPVSCSAGTSPFLAGTGPGELFIAGRNGIRRFDGVDCTTTPLPVSLPFGLRGATVRANGGVVMATIPPAFRLMWDGAAWRLFPDAADVPWRLTALAVTDVGGVLDAWAAGDDVVVHRRPDGIWVQEALPEALSAVDVHSIGPDRAWVVGDRLATKRGGMWTVTDGGGDTRAVCGLSDGDVWAVGDSINHDDGTGFAADAFVPREQLSRAFCVGPGEVWAAADNGLLLERRADTFVERNLSALRGARNLTAVGTGAGDAVIVASETAALAGSTVVAMRGGRAFFGHRIDGVDLIDSDARAGSDAWLVGGRGIAYRFGGAGLVPVTLATTLRANAVSVVGPTEIFILPEDGSVLAGDGAAPFSPAVPPVGTGFWIDLYASAADDIWAASATLPLRRWDGDAWQVDASAPVARGLAGIASDRVIAFDSAALYLWDGVTWTSLGNGGATGTFVDAWVGSTTFALAVTSSGDVVSTDGVSVTRELEGPSSSAAAVFGSSADDAWAVSDGSGGLQQRSAAGWAPVLTLETPSVIARTEEGLVAYDHRGDRWLLANDGFIRSGLDAPFVPDLYLADDDLWGVGNPLRHFDGLEDEALFLEGEVNDLAAAGGHIFTVGRYGEILHRAP